MRFGVGGSGDVGLGYAGTELRERRFILRGVEDVDRISQSVILLFLDCLSRIASESSRSYVECVSGKHCSPDGGE